MLKKLAKIDGAAEVAKNDQKVVNGGRLGYVPCSTACANASNGTWCGPPHCPGICDGNGGFNRI